MKVVVLGGTGSVGQLIANKLAAQGVKVLVLTRQAREPGNNIIFDLDKKSGI